MLASGIRKRLPELQRAVRARACAISDPLEVADPAYPQSLDGAIEAAIDYRIKVLEAPDRHAPGIAPALLVQARLDARDGVPVDISLRRYVAGNALFTDFLVEEAEKADVPIAILRRLLGAHATMGDSLLAAVSAEHAREVEMRIGSIAEQRRECVKRILAGELVDHSRLGYDLDAFHLALMVKGERARELLGRLATALDRHLLAVKREEEPIWAGWLGGQRPLDVDRVISAALDIAPDHVFLTVGEPGEGPSGWRLSHLQAKAALPIAERREQSVLSYSDVTVLASIARDDLLEASLRQLYLAPLEQARDGGETARKTLRAYLDAERNLSSTAAALGVDRRTVRNRISTIEQLLGRPLRGSLADLEIALQLVD
ncbi:MAG TPA: helix-turn-helix domain-containing protein [Solirubrobacterales bacterium]|nr:helix-turn-helix domain-containing protein [Solirubrobacterales bacterium]